MTDDTRTDERDQAKEALARSEERCREISAQLRSAQAELSDARMKARAAFDKVEALTKTLKDGQVEEHVKERDALRLQVGEAQKAAAALEKRFSEHETLLTDRQKEIIRLRHLADALRGSMETMQVARTAALDRERVAAQSEREMAAKVDGLEKAVRASEAARSPGGSGKA